MGSVESKEELETHDQVLRAYYRTTGLLNKFEHDNLIA